MSQNALDIIKQIGPRLRLLYIESNDSKVIAAARWYFKTLDNQTLIAITKEVE